MHSQGDSTPSDSLATNSSALVGILGRFDWSQFDIQKQQQQLRLYDVEPAQYAACPQRAVEKMLLLCKIVYFDLATSNLGSTCLVC